MNIIYRYTVSNTQGSNDFHLAGRLITSSIKEAVVQALSFWPFTDVIPLELSITYCGIVKEEPKIEEVILFGDE